MFVGAHGKGGKGTWECKDRGTFIMYGNGKNMH
jgi:hypothetical protein